MKYKSALIVSSLSFALLSVFVKLLGESISTTMLVLARLFLAAAIVFAVLYVQKKTGELKLSRKDVVEFVLFGVLLGASMYFYFKALLFAPLSTVVLIGFTAPFFSALLSHFLLKEKVKAATVIAIIASLAGVAVIISDEFSYSGFAWGHALIGAYVFSMVATSVFTKYEEKKHSLSQVVFWPFVFAAIFFLAVSLFEGATITGGPAEWALAAGIGVLTASGFLFYDTAMEKLDEHVVFAASQIMVTIFAITLAAVVLGEPVTQKTIIGGLILVCASFLVMERQGARIHHHFK